MRILAIDTSTSVLSLAVLEDNKIIVEFTQNKALTHSEKLMPCIEFILKNADLTIKDIDEFAVSIGPGSFTGIRIGVSVANAFAMIRGKSVIGISTLRSLAQNIRNFDGIIISTIYAQREDYYYGIYKSKNGEIEEITKEDAISINEIVNMAQEYAKESKVIFVGEICDNEKLDISYKNIVLAKKEENYTKASNICYLAKKSAPNKRDKYAVPVYIRKSQAEVEYEKRTE